MSDHLDDFTDLLGAYALDAVDPDEREAIELHLATCPRCRAEVAEHREVAAFLSQTGAPAPDGVWDRIAAELSPPAPALRMTFSRTGEVDPLAPAASSAEPPESAEGPDAPTSAEVTSITEARSARAVRARTFVAVVSAAAVLVAVLAVVTVGQSRRLDKMEAAVGNTVTMSQLANRAIGSSDVQVHLKGKQGTAQAVVEDSGQGYLIADGLPAPADGDVYQLWGQVDGRVLSLGTFGSDTSVVPFRLDPSRLKGIQSFAVTQERAPGVVASDQKPVVAGTI